MYMYLVTDKDYFIITMMNEIFCFFFHFDLFARVEGVGVGVA